MSTDRIRDLRRVVVSVAVAAVVALLPGAGSPAGVDHTPQVPTSLHPYPPGLRQLVDEPGPHPF